MESTVVLWHSHPHNIFVFCFIYIYNTITFKILFFSILPGAFQEDTQSLHTSLHFQPRELNHEHGCFFVVVQIFCSKKNSNIFFFYIFRLFSKNSLTRAGVFQILNLLRKQQYWLQTKYKITRHTRIFTCDMPIAYCDQRRTRF